MQKTTEKKLILLVDDNVFYHTTVGTILSDKYEVITAKSGREAIEHLLKGIVPDLVLLDIVMPEMDGWVTYRRIRELSLEQDIPIVFVTSMYGTSEVKHAYDMGAADFITKPYKREDLLNRIENIIQKKHANEPQKTVVPQ